MNKKQTYYAPEAELLVVRFEVNIMSYGAPGDPGSGFIDGGNILNGGDF